MRWTSVRMTGFRRRVRDEVATHRARRAEHAGGHRIRHYGLLANGNRRHNLATVRQLLLPPASATSAICDDPPGNTEQEVAPPTFVCRRCGKPMLIGRLFAPDPAIRAPPQRVAA